MPTSLVPAQQQMQPVMSLAIPEKVCWLAPALVLYSVWLLP
jgi:hypothetical protein